MPALAPRGRVLLASAFDNLLTLLIAGAAFLMLVLLWPMPPIWRPTLTEKTLVLLLLILLICGLSILFSVFELRNGTPGQRLAGVRHVRPDGSPLRFGDWLYRHWPSFLCIAFFVGAFIIVLNEPRLATSRMAVRWLTSRMLMLAVPTVLLLVAATLLGLLRPRTIVVRHDPQRIRGFEVIAPGQAGAASMRGGSKHA